MGAFYEHDGDGWVLAQDQDSPPDLAVACGLPQHGDYLGPWVWHELWQALQFLAVLFELVEE